MLEKITYADCGRSGAYSSAYLSNSASGLHAMVGVINRASIMHLTYFGMTPVLPFAGFGSFQG